MKGSIALYVWHDKLRYDEVVHLPGLVSVEDAVLFACAKFYGDPRASKVQLELGSLVFEPWSRGHGLIGGTAYKKGGRIW